VGSLRQLALDILHECTLMETACQKNDITPPSVAAGTKTTFWSDSWKDISASRSRTLGAIDTLSTLLHGPHGYLHEFVATSWDHGALYAFLQSPSLAQMASAGGPVTLPSLAEKSRIPEDKLMRILALLRCRNIVHEPEIGVFSLTAISEQLVKDEDFRAWVEFQLVACPTYEVAADILGFLRRELRVPISLMRSSRSRTNMLLAFRDSDKGMRPPVAY